MARTKMICVCACVLGKCWHVQDERRLHYPVLHETDRILHFAVPALTLNKSATGRFYMSLLLSLGEWMMMLSSSLVSEFILGGRSISLSQMPILFKLDYGLHLTYLEPAHPNTTFDFVFISDVCILSKPRLGFALDPIQPFGIILPHNQNSLVQVADQRMHNLVEIL